MFSQALTVNSIFHDFYSLMIDGGIDTKTIIIRPYESTDLPAMIAIWNAIVEEGNAFPQEECLTVESGEQFFAEQSYCGVAEHTKNREILGVYILHPNNIGRCGHICNASYAVAAHSRGQQIGRRLVQDCICQARRIGFGILQFNAVVKTNLHARHLYEQIGFHQLGTIPNGFRMKNGEYEDICPYYMEL